MPTELEYQIRIEGMEWHDLRILWEQIVARETPDWEPGKAFEYLVLAAFRLDGAQVRWPYQVQLFDEDLEQIDGAVHYGGLRCLVDSKDLVGNVAIEPIAKLRNQ